MRVTAATTAQEMVSLFDGAVGDLNTRYRDTLADLGVDMLHDDGFTADNLVEICAQVDEELKRLKAEPPKSGVPAVHTVAELQYVVAACGQAKGKAKGDAETQLAVALLTAALRREYDAVFGWTATKAEAVILKTVSPGFGELASAMPPTDVSTAESFALMRGAMGMAEQGPESVLAGKKTVAELKEVNDAFKHALDPLLALDEANAEKRENEEKTARRWDIVGTTIETGASVLESIGGGYSGKFKNTALGGVSDKILAPDNVRSICGRTANWIGIFAASVEAIHSIAEARTAADVAETKQFVAKRDAALLNDRVLAEKTLGVVSLCESMRALQTL